MSITREEILKAHKCPPELEVNLSDLLHRINILRGVYGQPMIVTSGYRTPDHNKRIGGAKNSAHLYCQAVDFRDLSGKLKDWMLQNAHVLEELGLWMEDPNYTRGWVHIQSRPAKSRVFIP